MPDSSFIIAVAAFAFVIAGFVKGVLGQGLPTVAIGLLSLVMSPGEGAALVVIPALLTNIWQGWFGPSLMPLIRRLWPTLLASFVSTFVATALGLGLLTPEAAALARKALGWAAGRLRVARRFAHPNPGAAARRAVAWSAVRRRQRGGRNHDRRV